MECLSTRPLLTFLCVCHLHVALGSVTFFCFFHVDVDVNLVWVNLKNKNKKFN